MTLQSVKAKTDRDLDRPWNMRLIRFLLEEGWFLLRARALDSGNPELVLDCVQLERGIRGIGDVRVRAAAVLYMMGFDQVEIGFVLGGRGRHDTGRELVDRALKSVHRFESRRWELRRESLG